MNGSNTATNRNSGKTGGDAYLSIDGIVKYCVTAPLLELPIDFKEWYKPTRGNTSRQYQV